MYKCGGVDLSAALVQKVARYREQLKESVPCSPDVSCDVKVCFRFGDGSQLTMRFSWD